MVAGNYLPGRNQKDVSMMGQPLLSINIPIYNRSSYLDRMLARFLEDKDLFEDKVALFISDNCSKEALSDVVQKYTDQGLRVFYDRNETNIGGDGNIVKCFKHGGGEYVWVLGSDDVPCRGVVREVVRILDSGKKYGLLHLDDKLENTAFREYESADALFEAMHVWITFISRNIVSGQYIARVPVEQYQSTSFAQIPVYLTAGYGASLNAIWTCDAFEAGCDSAANGGYNVFRVFCDNLLSLLRQFVAEGYMRKESYFRIKKAVYKNFTVHYILKFLVKRRENNFDTSGGWRIVFRNYGGHLYSYWYFFAGILHSMKYKLSRLVHKEGV